MEYSKRIPVLYINGKRFDKKYTLYVLADGYVKVIAFNSKTRNNDIYTFTFDEVEIKMEPRQSFEELKKEGSYNG